jgi:metallophosphoesterase (TIGR03768 family)
VTDDDRKKRGSILTGNDLKMLCGSEDLKIVLGVSRRDFMRYSAITAAGIYLGTLNAGCGGSSGTSQIAEYPIDSTVLKTTARTLSFPMPEKPAGPNSGTGLYPTELPLVSQYGKYGYGNYTFGGGLAIEKRFDIMPGGYNNQTPVRLKRFANFFAMTDVHMTDKEAPNQLIYIQQEDPIYGASGTSLYSPVMLYTTHVLDAAIQTINALHKQTPFDFGMCLGDVCDSTRYIELRWFIDVVDGKVITPSSGAHLGASTIDYQRPYKAAGLDKSIPWYQVLGNHDHFLIGSVAVDADPSLGIRQSYTSGNVWAIGDLLMPNSGLFPCVFDTTASIQERSFYTGVLDGSTPEGRIIHAGSVPSIDPPPTVAADPDRRSLLRTEWIQQFFDTTTSPAGHGFGLVDPAMGSGFACYRFVPKPDIPLKVIVLDDTQSETDGSHDIHGHGFLDAARWNWLKAELAAGQANNQLMIIAAHIPIAVAAIGSELEWWESDKDPNAKEQNAVTLAELISTLQNAPNLLMWIAGHRHVNTVKALKSPDPIRAPEKGFWQVETSSLRDYPQQFRTFEIYLNSDYTISIVAVNVDPAVAVGTPASTSRKYSIATQQIVQSNLTVNNRNIREASGYIPVEAMDPTRPQDGVTDPTIIYGSVPGVPYCASYNAELFKQLSPQMVSVLKAMFPRVAD